MKVKLTKIFQTDKNKAGEQLTNKFGPYWKVAIKTEQHGDEYLSGFFKNKVNWQVGQEIDIEVEIKGDFKNFKLIKPNQGVSQEEFDKLKSRVHDLERALADLTLETTGKIQTKSQYEDMNKRDAERREQLGIDDNFTPPF